MLLALAATGAAARGATSPLYDALVAVHAVVAVVGFATVAISGVYGGMAQRTARPQALEEVARYFRDRGRVELALLAVPFLGAAALSVRPAGRGFAQLWVVAAAGLWLTAASVLVFVVRPAERRLRAIVGAVAPAGLGGAAPALPASIRLDGRLVARGAAVCDVIFAVAFGLMIFQPR